MKKNLYLIFLLAALGTACGPSAEELAKTSRRDPGTTFIVERIGNQWFVLQYNSQNYGNHEKTLFLVFKSESRPDSLVFWWYRKDASGRPIPVAWTANIHRLKFGFDLPYQIVDTLRRVDLAAYFDPNPQKLYAYHAKSCPADFAYLHPGKLYTAGNSGSCYFSAVFPFTHFRLAGNILQVIFKPEKKEIVATIQPVKAEEKRYLVIVTFIFSLLSILFIFLFAFIYEGDVLLLGMGTPFSLFIFWIIYFIIEELPYGFFALGDHPWMGGVLVAFFQAILATCLLISLRRISIGRWLSRPIPAAIIVLILTTSASLWLLTNNWHFTWISALFTIGCTVLAQLIFRFPYYPDDDNGGSRRRKLPTPRPSEDKSKKEIGKPIIKKIKTPITKLPELEESMSEISKN